MDINLTLLSGRVVATPFVEFDADGARSARLLVLVRSERKYRFDVVPVVIADPSALDRSERANVGDRIYLSGSLIRRCSPKTPTVSRRLEVVADTVAFPDIDGETLSR